MAQGAFHPAPGLQPGIGAPKQALSRGETSDSLGLSYLIRAYQVTLHTMNTPLCWHVFPNSTISVVVLSVAV